MPKLELGGTSVINSTILLAHFQSRVCYFETMVRTAIVVRNPALLKSFEGGLLELMELAVLGNRWTKPSKEELEEFVALEKRINTMLDVIERELVLIAEGKPSPVQVVIIEG